jgi:hypothetical protein
LDIAVSLLPQNTEEKIEINLWRTKQF